MTDLDAIVRQHEHALRLGKFSAKDLRKALEEAQAAETERCAKLACAGCEAGLPTRYYGDLPSLFHTFPGEPDREHSLCTATRLGIKSKPLRAEREEKP